MQFPNNFNNKSFPQNSADWKPAFPFEVVNNFRKSKHTSNPSGTKAAVYHWHRLFPRELIKLREAAAFALQTGILSPK